MLHTLTNVYHQESILVWARFSKTGTGICSVHDSQIMHKWAYQYPFYAACKAQISVPRFEDASRLEKK